MPTLTDKTRSGITAVLRGERPGWRGKLLFAG
ncbi:hypothetical protein SAMN05444149_101422 [Pseudosulfitobacter pseudonitzschiae]|nr:hypothetical protein SAMN05444149_101422 [Pseudosulfitobacter pseudonitzschiae]